MIGDYRWATYYIAAPAALGGTAGYIGGRTNNRFLRIAAAVFVGTFDYHIVKDLIFEPELRSSQLIFGAAFNTSVVIGYLVGERRRFE